MTARFTFDRSRYPISYLLQQVSEAQVQRAVMETLTAHGIMAWVVDAGAAKLRGRAYGAMRRHGMFTDDAKAALVGRTGAGMKGLPDICGVLPGGRAIFVEVKKPEWLERRIVPRNMPCDVYAVRQKQPPGKPSPAQIEFITQARQRGAAAGFAWSVDDALAIAGL